MSLTDRERAFLDQHHTAAMITLRRDGTPHAVRVGVALVDGSLWSSGTRRRLRTAHLRRDPRSTLFVFEGRRYLTLETTVTILDGPDAPEMHVRLFQEMQRSLNLAPGRLMWNGEERGVDEFLRIMVDEERLIYEFEVTRAYGLY